LEPPGLWEVQFPSILSTWQSRDLDLEKLVYCVDFLSHISSILKDQHIIYNPSTLRRKTSINICDQICKKGPMLHFEMHVFQRSIFLQRYDNKNQM